ncbi:hypothetical protein HDU91_006503 [Kappamyces sp. JEL0680]|nr:hypothetical protein HDU91_006503 [Kappamyces sp. JEL0680]
MSLLNGIQVVNAPQNVRWNNNVPYLIHPHLDIGTAPSPMLILIFALLTEKKVLFIGHSRPCREVGNCVLSCVAIASGGDVIPGTIDRCFPYTSLANLDTLLQTPGYIAGVTNPVFEEQHNWWDVCINLSTNKMTISTSLMKTAPEMPKESVEFQGISCADDEDLTQEASISPNAAVYAYVERFVERSSRFSPSSLLKNVEPCWVNRVEGWTATTAFKALQKVGWFVSPQRGMRIRRSLFFRSSAQGMVQELCDPPTTEYKVDRYIRLFFHLDTLVQHATNHQIIELLSYLTSSDGACVPFSYGLYHERPEINQAAARIILRLYIQKLGPDYCNPFVKNGLLYILGPHLVDNITRPSAKSKSTRSYPDLSVKVGSPVNRIQSKTPRTPKTAVTSTSTSGAATPRTNQQALDDSQFSPAVKQFIPVLEIRGLDSGSEGTPIYSDLLLAQARNQQDLQAQIRFSLSQAADTPLEQPVQKLKIEPDSKYAARGSDELLSPTDSFLDLYSYPNGDAPSIDED